MIRSFQFVSVFPQTGIKNSDVHRQRSNISDMHTQGSEIYTRLHSQGSEIFDPNLT